MADRDAVISFCTSLLHSDEVLEEYSQNGLQVEGAIEVKKIAMGVSASRNFFEMAAAWGAHMCITHHGLFWRDGVTKITGPLAQRLSVLLKNDISLVSFHIPLDAHPEIGNNAAIIDILGLKKISPIDCGFLAEVTPPLPFKAFVDLVEQRIGHINFAAHFSEIPVQKIGVIAGGSAFLAKKVQETGADTFLFGEMSEKHYHELKELGLSFIAAGHFATERFGVQRLGEKIAAEFSDTEVQFFDEDCPV